MAPTLTLLKWHDILRHIDPSAIKYLEKHGLIDTQDATVAPEIRCAVCHECKPQALSYGRDGRNPKTSMELMYTDLEGSFHWDVTEMKNFQVFTDENTRDECVRRLMTRDVAVNTTAGYIEEMAREGMEIKCINGDRAGEHERSTSFNACWPIEESSGEAHLPGHLNSMEC